VRSSQQAPKGWRAWASGDVGVTFGLICHGRNESVADDADLRQDEFSLGSLLARRDRTLLQFVHIASAVHFLDPHDNLRGALIAIVIGEGFANRGDSASRPCDNE
jgi:hypothetical protein